MRKLVNEKIKKISANNYQIDAFSHYQIKKK